MPPEQWVRPHRTEELILGGDHKTQVVTTSQPAVAPTGTQKVHQVRLSAVGLHARDDPGLGNKPVLAPTSMPGGKIQRHLHQQPAWALREAGNWPFLYPGRYCTSQDFFDFQVHKRSPR